MQSKILAMTHPVRMRIMQALLNGNEMTAGEIAKKLGDIPQASLYRHINTLLEEEIIKVARENKIRGTVEKVFKLSDSLESDTEKEVENASREEHLNYFFTFLLSLLGQYEEYLQEDNINMKDDGVGFRQCMVYLNDEEFLELVTHIQTRLVEAMKNQPGNKRKLRSISSIIIPVASKIEDKGGL